MQYEKRYAEHISEINLFGRNPKLFRPWSQTSLLARQLTGFRCSFPGCKRKAKSTHHALLRERGKILQPDGAEKIIWVPIAGFEVPGLHAFPLCDCHHHDRDNPECAHHWKNWYAGAEGGARLDARQRVHYYHLLTQGWDEKTRHHKRSA